MASTIFRPVAPSSNISAFRLPRLRRSLVHCLSWSVISCFHHFCNFPRKVRSRGPAQNLAQFAKNECRLSSFPIELNFFQKEACLPNSRNESMTMIEAPRTGLLHNNKLFQFKVGGKKNSLFYLFFWKHK